MSTKLINQNYQYPEYFNWPFFFTIQKHTETKKKQLLMWNELILKFCKDNKVWRLSKSDLLENMGKNDKINRRLSLDAIDIIISSMVENKRAEYVDKKSKDEVFIFWKTFNEWKEYLYASAVTRRSIDQLETLDGITMDDMNQSEEYYMMDRTLLINILKELEKEGKCAVY